MTPSSSDCVLQATLLGPPSPAAGPSTSSWDPVSARLSCSRLSDSGKDLKCLYLGGTTGRIWWFWGAAPCPHPPPPHCEGTHCSTRSPKSSSTRSCLCQRGRGNPPVATSLSPAVPRGPSISAGLCRQGTAKGGQRSTTSTPASFFAPPALSAPPEALPCSPRGAGSRRPAVGKGPEGSGAGSGIAGGAAAWPQAPAAPSAPPSAAPGGKSPLPPRCKTATISVGETPNPEARGAGGTGPWGFAGGEGAVGVKHLPVGIKLPRCPWVLLPGSQVRPLQRILRIPQLPKPLRHNGGDVRVCRLSPWSPPPPRPRRAPPGWGARMGPTHLELLLGRGAPSPDPAFEGFHLAGRERAEPSPAAAPRCSPPFPLQPPIPTAAPSLELAWACSLWVWPASVRVNWVPGQRHGPGQVGQPPPGGGGEGGGWGDPSRSDGAGAARKHEDEVMHRSPHPTVEKPWVWGGSAQQPPPPKPEQEGDGETTVQPTSTQRGQWGWGRGRAESCRPGLRDAEGHHLAAGAHGAHGEAAAGPWRVGVQAHLGAGRGGLCTHPAPQPWRCPPDVPLGSPVGTAGRQGRRWGHGAGGGHSRAPALPQFPHPRSGAGREAARATRGRASARRPAISVTCPAAAPAISGPVSAQPPPWRGGEPARRGGKRPPVLVWALRWPRPPLPRLGLLNRSPPGGGRAGGGTRGRRDPE